MQGLSQNQGATLAKLLAEGWKRVLPDRPSLVVGGPIIVQDPSGKSFQINPDGTTAPVTGEKTGGQI
jgi:hypothetical protein